MSQVPNLGDKSRIVGPVSSSGSGFRLRADLNPYLTGDVTLESGTFITLGQAGQFITINYSGPTPPDPANTAPPEVQESSVLGASARYALQDHTHQSPTIYWPQGAGPNDNVVSNRDTAPTRTPAASGATNFCNYAPGSALDGATGVDCTISGGRDNSALSLYDTIGGGYVNATLASTDSEPSNTICGGLTNQTLGFHHATICGGSYNTIFNFDDPLYEGMGGCITGGSENEVYRSGGRSGGFRAVSYAVGEDSFACGSESGDHGDSQDSRVVVTGSTPGAAPNESVTLRQYVEPLAADNVVLMRPNMAYVMHVRVVAADTASTSQAVWIYGVSARTDGTPVLTINDASVIYSHNDAGSASWTISISASGNELQVIFSTGAGVTDSVKITAVVEYAQIINTLGDIMSEARASILAELRGPKGFPALYQGKSSNIPIILSIYENGLDPRSSEQLAALKAEFAKNGGTYPIASDFSNGFSPFLMGGLAVPMFSSVTLHIPKILAAIGESTLTPYTYRLIWRARSFATSVSTNAPFHSPNSRPGPNYDGQGQVLSPAPGGAVWTGACEKRLPIYAAESSLAYAQTEPTTEDASFQNVYPNYTRVFKVNGGGNEEKPIVPAFESGQYAECDITQGFASTLAGNVEHIAHIERAMGDELCLLVYRESAGGISGNWNFSSIDAGILPFYSRDINEQSASRLKRPGVLISTGLAP